MLMVVFGAGASYDSSADFAPTEERQAIVRIGALRDSRPPLANDLFALRPTFRNVARNLPKCMLILSDLRKREPGVSVEQRLSDFREDKKELVAVQFYLQWIIGESQAQWNDRISTHTTYRPLLRQIDQQMKGEPVCMVTFNYDTLLEEAFSSLNRNLTYESLQDYISREDFKIIKAHGSVNWIREITSMMNADSKDPVQQANITIEIADRIEPSDNYHIVSIPGPGGHWIASSCLPEGRTAEQIALPAIAIPLEKKSGFACPANHVEVLKECISKTDKLLLIGWKGAERDFVGLLAERLNKSIPRMVVSSRRESADKIRDALINAGLSAGVGGWVCSEHGFTDSVRSGEIENFVRQQ